MQFRHYDASGRHVSEFPMRPISLSWSPARLSRRQGRLAWIAVWLIGFLAGVVVLLALSIKSRLDAFETDARIAHRLLSQRVVQHEAVLATLSLMQPGADVRLPAIYPQFLQMLRRSDDQPWAADAPVAAALSAAERIKGRPQLALADLASGRFWIVMAGNAPDNASYALEISLPLMIPSEDWPFGTASEAVVQGGQSDATPSQASQSAASGLQATPSQATRVTLEYGRTGWTIHAGIPGSSAAESAEFRRFVFRKALAAASQPFDLVAERGYGLRDLPWLATGLWLLIWSAALGVLATAVRQSGARKRAEELLRLGQVSRLNTLGELAAGLAHELNQPLTAIVANTQATVRLLADDPPEIDQARGAMEKAVTQARRAADVVARLRRAIERPNAGARVSLDLAEGARDVLQLLEPEFRKRAVALEFQSVPVAHAIGDPVALEQIIHNLVMNALAALELIDDRQRELVVTIAAGTTPSTVLLSVRDNGPGVPRDMAERIFEPFVTGRRGGLGLGLSLCETLALEMGGSLRFTPAIPGAVFSLELPVAAPSPEVTTPTADAT